MASEAHHARARELLNNVDKAKVQRDNNDRIRNALLDAEDFLHQLHSQCFAQRTYADIQRAVEDAETNLKRYETELCYDHTVRRHAAARYVEECQLETPPDSLVDDDHVAHFRGVDTALKRFAELKQICVDRKLQRRHKQHAKWSVEEGPVHSAAGADLIGSRSSGGVSRSIDSEAAAMAAELSGGVAGSPEDAKAAEVAAADDEDMLLFVDTALTSFNKANRLVERSRIDSDVWLPVIEPLLDAIATVLSARPVAETLREGDDEIRDLTLEDARLQQQCQEEEACGNVTRCEELTCQRLTLLETIADLATERFRRLSETERDTIESLTKNVEVVKRIATSKADTLMKEVRQRRQALNSDSTKIELQTAKAQDDESLARSDFVRQKNESDALLHDLREQQQAKWHALLALERELAGLAQRHRDEIDRRVRMMEREERRRCHMTQFSSFADEHTTVLERSMESCRADEELGEFMLEFVRQSCFAIENKVASVQGQLQQVRKSAFHDHATHFRKQYLCLGDLMYRKERLAEEIGKRIELLNIQQEAAMDNFDPRAKSLAVQRGELEVRKAEVEAFLAQLREKAEVYVESFKPTESVLAMESSSFVHPLAELKKVNRIRSKKVDAYYATVVATKTAQPARTGGAASVHRAPLVPPSQAELEAEKDALQRDVDAVSEIKAKRVAQRQQVLLAARAGAAADPSLPSLMPRSLSSGGTTGGLLPKRSSPPRHNSRDNSRLSPSDATGVVQSPERPQPPRSTKYSTGLHTCGQLEPFGGRALEGLPMDGSVLKGGIASTLD